MVTKPTSISYYQIQNIYYIKDITNSDNKIINTSAVNLIFV